MAQATLSEMGVEGFLAAGSREYGVPFLDAVQEALIVWEQCGQGKRDQGGNLTVKQAPGQLLPRIVYEILQRFEGKAPDWPVDRSPIPETTREVGARVTPRDLVYDVLLDFLEGCLWSRGTGIELTLADSRAYVRAGAAERATDRIETIFGALLKSPRLPPDREVMELKERVRVLTEMVSEARDKGFVTKGVA